MTPGQFLTRTGRACAQAAWSLSHGRSRFNATPASVVITTLGKSQSFSGNCSRLESSFCLQRGGDFFFVKMSQLNLTKPAPEFSASAVVDGEFKEVKLSQYRGKYVVLFFYPLDFTFVCPTEIIAFSDRVEEFRSINCEVLAASTDSVFSHLAWVNTPRKQGGLGSMNIPLIEDKTHAISKMYGCLKEEEGIAFRGLFIIDDKGNLRQITINDLPVGRSVDETLRLVQAFQFTDKHGEVCPAGWKPGAATIKPGVSESKDYFAKAN